MFTTDQLSALEAALASGVLKVRYADREETYQSTEQMLRLRELMRAELGLGGSGSGKGHSGFARYPVYSKGLE